MSLEWHVEEHGLEMGREAHSIVKYLCDGDKVRRPWDRWNFLVIIADCQS